MAETVLVNAATVAAGDSTAVVAHQMAVPGVQFRVVSDLQFTARFWVADVDFTDTADAAELQGTADSPGATTGLVYTIHPGAYDYVACVVTNDDVSNASEVTIAVGFDLVAEVPSALFTVAEARAFDKAQLVADTDYSDAVIIAKEAELREWFCQIFGVDFIPTVHTDEVVDGLGHNEVMLKWPLITAITALSYRNYGSTTYTALDAGQLAMCQSTLSGTVVYEGGYLPKGRNTVKATYTAGHATVPARIKRAALQMAVEELPASTVPYQADGFESGGVSYNFRADGFRDSWFASQDGQAAFRAYSMKLPGVA